ncbi:fumarate hydratase [Spirochaetia bacterium]|nr:fumarate hydratase [Spirochaetia bacterium]
MARILNTQILIPVIAGLCKKSCYELDNNFLQAVRDALQKEESAYARYTLQLILDNAEYAKKEQIACCQDTGTCIVFMEVGQDVAWEGLPLRDAVDEGVRQGYTTGFLRKSMVRDPLDRVNTGDNTPAMLHTEIVCGDKIKITVMPKGGGSENMGALTTLVPSAGEQGIKEFVVKTVEAAGGKTCPPVIVGVGVGGTVDVCAYLAKKALLRPCGSRNANPRYANLETELLEAINNLGIGALGMGGRVTALDVHIEYYPCHITALPVAISFLCHSARQANACI